VGVTDAQEGFIGLMMRGLGLELDIYICYRIFCAAPSTIILSPSLSRRASAKFSKLLTQKPSRSDELFRASRFVGR
jgi:hypothetical protein